MDFRCWLAPDDADLANDVRYKKDATRNCERPRQLLWVDLGHFH